MREYETLFIVQPDASETQLTAFRDRVSGIIEKHQGRLFLANNLGKRTLAYPIQKHSKGIYTCLDYAGSGGCVSEIEKMMNLDESVLRFLTVVKNTDVDMEKRAMEIVARGEDRPADAAVAKEASAVGESSDIREESQKEDA